MADTQARPDLQKLIRRLEHFASGPGYHLIDVDGVFTLTSTEQAG